VRRDHLHGRFAIWWLGIAAAVAVLGFFPRLTDWLAVKLGIGYPPILAVVVGIGVLVLKIIAMDIEHSRSEVKIQRLTQRLGMLEAELMERDKQNRNDSAG